MRQTSAAVLFLLLAIPALAEDQKGPADAAKAQADAQKRLLQQFDANRDGVLSEEEKIRAQELIRRQGLLGLDIPAGGFKDADEILKGFDKDRDGKLSAAERAAAQAAWQRMRSRSGGVVSGGQAGAAPGAGNVVPPQAPAKPPKVSGLVKRFDKDGDGKLNQEEKDALQAEVGKRKPKKADAKKDAP